MTDMILVEDKELYYLLAENYLLSEFNAENVDVDDVVEYIEDKTHLNLLPTYHKYGFEAWVELLGEWIATERHMKRVYDTIPTDGAKFYFEREENESKRDYIARLIGNAKFDTSAKIMGKLEHSGHEIWFNVKENDTYESILFDIEGCLSSWEDRK